MEIWQVALGYIADSFISILVIPIITYWGDIRYLVKISNYSWYY